ncbi:MAG: DUF177 domain-containing protein [Rhodospirillaceae bacterium]|nr:DUF177 domain-containing protein [Rhodospirillaceae bacterium]
MSAEVAPEFSFPVDITTLPAIGRSYPIKASPEECGLVAARLGLQSIGAINAVLEITPAGKGLIKVTGTVKAEVVQTCVVSLAPVPAHVEDAVSATFVTEERAAADALKKERAKARKSVPKKAAGEEEEVIGLQGDDPPEIARDGRIDLGEVAVVHLALALDPYPKAPGAAFDAQAWGGEGEKDEKATVVSPFAALAKLKKPGA